MEIVFYQRNTATKQRLTPAFDFSVRSFTWDVRWGPTIADASAAYIPDSPDSWEATKLIRCPVEFYDNGVPVWWGYVYSARIPRENITIGVSLENMYNKLQVTYSNLAAGATASTSGATTDAANGTVSQSIFGTKEHIEPIGDNTSTGAENRRDVLLAIHQYPTQTIDPVKSTSIELRFRGWGDTLDWRYYTNAGTTSTATTTQVSDILSGVGEFVSTAHIFNASGVSTNEYQDGQKTAKTLIESLMDMGTSSGSPYSYMVNRNRILEVKQLDAFGTRPKYKLRDDALLESLGVVVDPSKIYDYLGQWATLKSAPATLTDYSGVQPFLIESATWANGKVSYRPQGQADIMKALFSRKMV